MVKKKKTEKNPDVFEQTLGAWRRKESPDEIREKIREEFRSSMMKHKK